jgi:L-2-hydroxyglutarate oxidase LhgO
MDEYLKVFFRRLFLRQIQRLVPSLTREDIKPSKCGVRAQAVDRQGEPIDDFHIECSRNTIHVLNAPSPAATACLAIGEHIEQMAVKQFKLES